jgi:hypothetical protein
MGEEAEEPGENYGSVTCYVKLYGKYQDDKINWFEKVGLRRTHESDDKL